MAEPNRCGMLLGTEMYALGPTSLTWQALQARTAPTAEQVADAVRQALAACDPERTSATQTTDTIDVVLLDTFGPWVSPWRWDGFTQAWCCPGHSVRRSEDRDDEATVTRAVRAVLEWSDFIDALSVIFDERTAEDKGLPLSEATERAASRLLPLVLARTDAYDAWYFTFACVLSWFLQSRGYTDPSLRDAVLETASGQFESWVEPSPEVASQACAALGRVVGDAEPGERTLDALDVWQRNRGKVCGDSDAKQHRGPALGDAHRRYIERVDRRRGDARADGLLAALDQARAWARTDAPLSFAVLQSWQADILGTPTPGFRRGPAHRDHHVYGFDSAVPARFARKLAEALDPDEPWPTRAARLYLDVCFFHPFEDGNARAARIALDALLTREGLVLRCVAPLAQLRRSATDPDVAPSLVLALQHLVTRR